MKTNKDTNGKLLEMEATFNEFSKEPPAHYHPFQMEEFMVISGELTIRIDGDLMILKQNDTLYIPKCKLHFMWNNSDLKTIVNWKIQPAMIAEYLLETVTGLANDGKTNSDGIPNFIQSILMANKYSDVFRIAKPPFTVQKVLFNILTPFAYLSGYKPTSKKYLD